MRASKAFYLLLVVSLTTIILIACSSIKGEEATPFDLLSTSTVSPSMMAATLVSNTNYMQECKRINPEIRQGQIDYLNIYPGQTRVEDIEAMIGKPIKRNDPSANDREWHYDNFNVYIKRGNDVVDSILVFGDTQFMVSLEYLVKEYGCPDLIYAIDKSEDYPSGAYSFTEFIYFRNGVEFAFDSFPVHLSDLPVFIDFFVPQFLEEYSYNYIYPNYEVGKPVTWDEAVIERR